MTCRDDDDDRHTDTEHITDMEQGQEHTRCWSCTTVRRKMRSGKRGRQVEYAGGLRREARKQAGSRSIATHTHKGCHGTDRLGFE